MPLASAVVLERSYYCHWRRGTNSSQSSNDFWVQLFVNVVDKL